MISEKLVNIFVGANQLLLQVINSTSQKQLVQCIDEKTGAKEVT